MAKTLLLLPGDGIGPEICAEVRRVAAWLAAQGALDLAIDEMAFGGASYDRHGVPLTDAAKAAALAADAVLMGAVGGPRWADVARRERPEAGLLALRQAMG
ncbi:MAG: 3-isopropylmalate dehydrogenase, partial [Alphaproteobacteria bacterium]